MLFRLLADLAVAVAVAVAAALVVLVLAAGAALADNDIRRVVILDTFDAEKAETGAGPTVVVVVPGSVLDFASTGMQDARRFLVLPATQLVLVAEAEAATLEEEGASSQFIMAHSSISSTTGVGIGAVAVAVAVAVAAVVLTACLAATALLELELELGSPPTEARRCLLLATRAVPAAGATRAAGAAGAAGATPRCSFSSSTDSLERVGRPLTEEQEEEEEEVAMEDLPADEATVVQSSMEPVLLKEELASCSPLLLCLLAKDAFRASMALSAS
jgi:hypothetical protein